MASRSKKVTKLKKYENSINGKVIDLKRFAYDVIVFSLPRFAVPGNCICRLNGPENDYGSTKFREVMSSLVVRHQIFNRFEWNKVFESQYGENNLESIEKMKVVLMQVVRDLLTPLTLISYELELVLAAISELIVFLYSKNCNLHLEELAKFWVEYLKPKRQNFRSFGGVEKWHNEGIEFQGEFIDAFHSVFISKVCPSYEDSAKNEYLTSQYLATRARFSSELQAKQQELASQRPRNISEEVTEDISRFVTLQQEAAFVEYVTSQQENASGNDALNNTGLGIPPHEERLRFSCSSVSDDATPSENLPGTSRRERTKHLKGLSSEQKRHKAKYGVLPNVEQSSGQSSVKSSGTKRSSEKRSSVADAPTAFQNLPGTSREPSMHFTRSSGHQKSKYSSCSIETQGSGRPILDSSRTKLSSERKPSISEASDAPTAFQNIPGRTGQEPTEHHHRESSGRQKRESGLCPSVEQAFFDLTLDSSGMKQSGERKPSVSVAQDPKPSENSPSGSCRKTAQDNKKESSNRQKKSNSRSSEEE